MTIKISPMSTLSLLIIQFLLVTASIAVFGRPFRLESAYADDWPRLVWGVVVQRVAVAIACVAFFVAGTYAGYVATFSLPGSAAAASWLNVLFAVIFGAAAIAGVRIRASLARRE